MTQRRHKVLDLTIALIAVLTLMVALMPASAHATVVNGVEDCLNPDPTLDSDKDGFSNAEECGSIPVPGTGGASLSYCGTNPHTNLCVNPNEQDVVIYLFPASPSNIPGSPDILFDIVKTLGVTSHVFVNPTGVTQSNRQVTATQKGAVVFEDLNTNAIAMGQSKWGGPNLVTDVDTRIYTQKIICFVNQQYGLTTTACTDTSHADMYNQYIRRTFNHEVSHVLALTNHYDATLKNHYSDTQAYLMNKNVTVTKKGSTITWKIPTAYTSTEPQQDCYNVSVLNSSNNGVCQ